MEGGEEASVGEEVARLKSIFGGGGIYMYARARLGFGLYL